MKRRRRVRRSQATPKWLSITSKYVVVTGWQIVWWLVVISIVGGIFYVFHRGIFKVKVVDCRINDSGEVCPETIVSELDRLKGKLILTIRTSKIKQKLLTADPKISSVSIEVKLPDRLETQIWYQPATFAVQTATDSAAFVVDESGRIVSLAQKADANLVSIIAKQAQEMSVGDTIVDSQLRYALSVAKALQKSYIVFQYIEVVDRDTIKVILADDRKVLLSPNKELEKSVTSLQLILSKATIPADPVVIDLRFDKPVLK